MTGKHLRACIVCPHFPPHTVACGVGDYTSQIAHGMVKRGHTITIIASTGYTGPESINGLRIVPFAASFGLAAGLRLFGFLAKNRFDLVNVQYTPALYGFWFRVALCLINPFTPVVLSLHTLHASTFMSKIEVVMLLLFCRGFISTNEEITALLGKTPCMQKNFLEAPIGANIVPVVQRPSREAAKHSLGIPPNHLVIANFGLFYPGRGIETLLMACKLLHDKKSPDFVLLLMGTIREIDMPYYNHITQAIRDLQLESAVRITGRLEPEAVSTHLFAADIYALPFDRGASVRRGTLIAGIEHGMAIVTTKPETRSKYLTQESGAFAFVPAKDPDALMNTIWDLWKIPEARAALEKNSAALRASFSWDAINAMVEREFVRQTRTTQ